MENSGKITLQVRKGVKSPILETIVLSPPDSVYFMGICGTALASLAVFLKARGFSVFGSDSQVYPPMSSFLREKGIPIKNYSPKNLKVSLKLVVVGNVISRNHPEVETLERLSLPYISFPEFLEQALLKGKNIVVAGTHGKTTTTALAAYVARKAGKDPGFFVGGLPRDMKSSFHHTNSEWFAIEGDEYDTAFFAKHPKFFHYRPFALILTGIEFDHGDIYGDLHEILEVFSQLVTQVPLQGLVIASAEDRGVGEVLKNSQIKARVLTYGINKGNFQVKNPVIKKEKNQFEVFYKGSKVGFLSLNLLGEHNSLNALSVFAMAYILEWPLKKVFKAFDSFQGVKRRLERIEERGGVLLLEDFAHHPTAVRKTLQGLKSAFPCNRIIAVFEPRSFTSCLNVFQEDYAKALSLADVAVVAKPFRASVAKEKRLSSRQLVQDIERLGKKALFVENVEDLPFQLLSFIEPGDRVVVMSNGDFGNLVCRLQEGLKKKFSIINKEFNP